MKKQVCVLANTLCNIGGIETFVYNWCLLMKDTYDIVVAVSTIANDQLIRLKKIVKVVKNTEDIECDTLIVMHIATKEIPSNIKYKYKVQMVHGCKSIAYSYIPQSDLLVPVSNSAKESYGKEFDGRKIKVIHNPTKTIKDKKVLKLVSCTRLTKEKGKERMIKFAKQLKANNIPYVWFVLTNNKIETDDEDLFIHIKPTLNIETFIKGCDYLVQLSDTESFSYSMVEALELGVPVITTPVEPLEEIGVIDGVNGFIIPFDMNNIDIQKIYESHLKFDYEFDNDIIYKQWCEVIGEPKPFIPYEEEIMKVKVTKTFRDSTNKNQYVYAGSIYECDEERGKHIVELGYAEEMPQPKEIKIERAIADQETEKAVEKKVVKKATAPKRLMQRNSPLVNAFYQSKVWEQTRNAYYKSKLGMCERCNSCNGKMIVHHKVYINDRNVNDYSITLDFNNLELLCIDCHNKEHFKNKIPYEFDEQGNLIKYE